MSNMQSSILHIWSWDPVRDVDNRITSLAYCICVWVLHIVCTSTWIGGPRRKQWEVVTYSTTKLNLFNYQTSSVRECVWDKEKDRERERERERVSVRNCERECARTGVCGVCVCARTCMHACSNKNLRRLNITFWCDQQNNKSFIFVYIFLKLLYPEFQNLIFIFHGLYFVYSLSDIIILSVAHCIKITDTVFELLKLIFKY
jgi:hypothetical protein